MKNVVFRGALIVLPCFLVGCATNQAQVSMLHAPEVGAAAAYRAVSVAQFSGQMGNSVSAALESSMMNARVKNKPVYRSVTRVPEARSLGNEGAVTAKARSLGSDAVLTGEVLRADVQDGRSTTTQYVCRQYEQSKKLIKKCISGSNVQVACTDRSASMQVQVRLFDAKTGAAVYNEAINKESQSRGCGDERPTDGRVMLAALQEEVVTEIMKKIVPHDRQVSVQFMDADNRIAASARKERFAGALRFVMEQRMDRGCEIFRELYEQEKESVALNYNLGICEEVEGNIFRASELYSAADRLSNEPNKLITAALKRNEQDIRKVSVLAKGREDLVKEDKIEAGAAPQTIRDPKQGRVTTAKVAQPARPDNVGDDVLLTGRRSALVIGNSKYRYVSALTNPANDARAMSAELRKAGFEVVAVEDANLEKMSHAIEKFAASIKQGGAALVFYAGHGFQVKGENYLVPVDANLKGESDVSSKTINLSQILTKLEDAKSQVNVVILDACRDNPFAGAWRSAASRGLASIDAPSGTVIAFATAPGKTASDGSAGNGLFTSHLLRQLRTPDQKLEDVLKNTRKGVAAASNNAQIPWDSSSLTGDFYFRVSSAQ